MPIHVSSEEPRATCTVKKEASSFPQKLFIQDEFAKVVSPDASPDAPAENEPLTLNSVTAGALEVASPSTEAIHSRYLYHSLDSQGNEAVLDRVSMSRFPMRSKPLDRYIQRLQERWGLVIVVLVVLFVAITVAVLIGIGFGRLAKSNVEAA
jgi:hypothetical protein